MEKPIRALITITVGAVVLALGSAPALAQKSRQSSRPECVDRYVEFSLRNYLFGVSPAPQANGCAPAVYSGGRFIGQDPDPNVRLQMRRDPDNEGHHLNTR